MCQLIILTAYILQKWRKLTSTFIQRGIDSEYSRLVYALWQQSSVWQSITGIGKLHMQHSAQLSYTTITPSRLTPKYRPLDWAFTRFIVVFMAVVNCWFYSFPLWPITLTKSVNLWLTVTPYGANGVKWLTDVLHCLFFIWQSIWRTNTSWWAN